jgi:hypothetical protein
VLTDLKTAEVNGDRAWPYELYHATLLNIVFALNSGVDKYIARGRTLCNVLVGHLRGVGMFDSEAAERMRRTFFPGTFLPYKLGVLEDRNKLVACLFKVEAYMALLGDSLPQISPAELDIGLPQTFGQRNSWGILVWYKRLPDEPTDRATLNLSDVVLRRSEPSTLLVEDIELGLCAMAPSLWKYNQDRRRGAECAASREDLSSELTSWKSDLDDILHSCSIQADRDAPGSNATDFPLRAYRGDDDEKPNEWKALAFNRVQTLAQYTTILFHLLSLHLYADIGTLCQSSDAEVSQLVGEPESAATQGWQEINTAAKEWKRRKASKYGGHAAIHALAIIRTAEALSLKLNLPANHLEAIGRVGLEVSLKILKA